MGSGEVRFGLVLGKKKNMLMRFARLLCRFLVLVAIGIHTNVVMAKVIWQIPVFVVNPDLTRDSQRLEYFASPDTACIAYFESYKTYVEPSTFGAAYSGYTFEFHETKRSRPPFDVYPYFFGCYGRLPIFPLNGTYLNVSDFEQNMIDVCHPDAGYISAYKSGYIFELATMQAIKSCIEDVTPPNMCKAGESAGGMSSRPILPATGEKIKLQTDFTDAAPHPLDFTRTYRTAWGDVTPASGMGANWNHRFGMQLTNVGGAAASATTLSKTLQLPDGSQRRFTRTATTSAWVNTDGTDQLVENATGTLYTSAQNDDIWQFNALGKPVTLTQRNGWAYTLAYNAAGQLATVTNKFGRVLSFSYGAAGSATAGLLVGVSAPDGQTISYNYNSTPSLIYAGYGSTSAPNTTSVQYLYENASFPKALTGMVDETNTRSATYTYDAQGRAVSSELAGGADKYQVSYGTSTAAGALNTSATITDPLGTARSYTYSNTAGSLAVTGANVTSNGQMPGSDAASRVQNASGLIDSETDYLGVKTMFTWDINRKLPLSTTKAAGLPEAQTTNTTWHPTLRLPVSIAETGRSTSYTYDAVGNRLSQAITDTTAGTTSGQVKTTTWTYNPQGLVATEELRPQLTTPPATSPPSKTPSTKPPVT
jgi:YD repeat-containing protein